MVCLGVYLIRWGGYFDVFNRTAGRTRILGSSSAVFTALGQWTQNIGWKKGKTLLCASLQFSAVIFAVIFGYLFFDEVPDTFTFLGILIIVAASLGATIFRLKYYKEG